MRRRSARSWIEHPRGGDVDRRRRASVEDHEAQVGHVGGQVTHLRADEVGVREEQWAPRRGRRARPGRWGSPRCGRRRSRAGRRRPRRGPGSAMWGRDVRGDQQDEGHRDPDDQAGQRVEQQHPEQGGEGSDEVGAAGQPVHAGQPPGLDPPQAPERRDVDELDDRGDDDGRQGGLGQLLEQPGQEQQGDHGQGGRGQARELRAGTRGAVHRRLRQAAVDDHARRSAPRRGWRHRDPAAHGWRRCRSPPSRRTSSRRRDLRRTRRASPRPHPPSRSMNWLPETSGRPTWGRPESMWPMISSPWSSSPNSATTAMPASATTREAGRSGTKRRRTSEGERSCRRRRPR